MIQLPKTDKQDLPPLEPGIYHDMPADEYHRHIGVTHSFLVQCQRSLAHGHAYRRVGKDATADMRFGKAYHTLLLEPAKFAETYHIWSGLPRNKLAKNGGGKEEYDELLEAVKDADLIITKADHADMLAMAARLREEKELIPLLECPGEYELTIAWIDKVTGLPCRARLDKLARSLDMIVDLKKARSAEGWKFGSQGAMLGYDIEAAFYVDGAEQVGLGSNGFAFVAQEDTDPFLPAVFNVGDEEMEAGRRKYRPMMPAIAKCCEMDVWPGYPSFVQAFKMPRYAYPEEIIGEQMETVKWTGEELTAEQLAAMNEEF